MKRKRRKERMNKRKSKERRQGIKNKKQMKVRHNILQTGRK
jgi:hypothetical protein